MFIIYVDGDACPVKEEVYRVATRYESRVVVVANSPLRVPADARVELVVRSGFGVVDDWIAEQAGSGDIVVTADIGLAARCLEKRAWSSIPEAGLSARAILASCSHARPDGNPPPRRHGHRRTATHDSERPVAIPVHTRRGGQCRPPSVFIEVAATLLNSCSNGEGM